MGAGRGLLQAAPVYPSDPGLPDVATTPPPSTRPPPISPPPDFPDYPIEPPYMPDVIFVEPPYPPIPRPPLPAPLTTPPPSTATPDVGSVDLKALQTYVNAAVEFCTGECVGESHERPVDVRVTDARMCWMPAPRTGHGPDRGGAWGLDRVKEELV